MFPGVLSAQEGKSSPQALAAGSSSSTVAPSVLGGALNQYLGLRVRDIRFEGIEDAAALKHLRELVQPAIDQPLDRLSLRRCLRVLHATGYFSNLEVEAERNSSEEITLVFMVRQSYFVGAVSVEGLPRHPAPHQLISASKLQLGEPYSREKVEAAVQNMQSVMTDNGFYQAHIDHQEEFHPDTQQVDIHFRVSPGEHARVGQVQIQGESGIEAPQFERITGLQPGHTLTEQKVSKALKKVRKKYQKEHRLEAQVAVTDRKYDAQDNSLAYVFQIDQGPRVEIRVEGARVSHNRLKKLVPVFEEGTVDDDLLNEGLRNLRDYFQTQGFFLAKVSWSREVDPEETLLSVVYKVDLGARYELSDIHIEGNKTFSTELIRERMLVKPASNLLTHGMYSETLLNRDIDVITESLYKANGFSRVKIDRVITDHYQGAPGHMLITLHIEEGPQIRVDSVKLVGIHAFDPATLEARLEAEGAGLVTVPGQPFSESNVAQDRDVLMGFYFNNGFPNVQLETSYKPAADAPERMDVVFTVREGDQVMVNRVLYSGLNYTRPEVVNRVTQVTPGTPLSQLSMLETQRALYDLGLFNQVEMAVQNPEGKAYYKNVLFQVQEAKRWTFDYGFGFEVQTAGQPVDVINTAPAPGVNLPSNTIPYNGGKPVANPEPSTTFSPSVAFEVTRINFRGRDDTISLKTHLSNLQKRALLSYTTPHWLDRNNWRLSFTGDYDDRRDVRTFASQRVEGSAQLQDVISRRADGEPITTLLIRYSYRRVEVDANTLAISTPLVPLLSKPVLVGMPSFTYIRDRRDNVLDAHRGNYTTVDFGVSAKVFGSGEEQSAQVQIENGGLTPAATAANFTRLVAQNSTYTPFWRDTRTRDDRRIVFARTTRIGIENVLGASPTAEPIPLPERFFGGGADSNRAFALNQAGPRDLFTGFPLGGNASFYNSFELRFPPPTLPLVGSNMSFVLFHDFGNVFQTSTEMLHSFGRWSQPDRSSCMIATTPPESPTCQFDYMSQALGTGIRYKTPIGPIRVDASYNLNPPTFPYFVQCPSTPVDTAPCNVSGPNSVFFQHANLRHFNFFFSIGQSF